MAEPRVPAIQLIIKTVVLNIFNPNKLINIPKQKKIETKSISLSSMKTIKESKLATGHPNCEAPTT